MLPHPSPAKLGGPADTEQVKSEKQIQPGEQGGKEKGGHRDVSIPDPEQEVGAGERAQNL